jgi:plastocyanin
MQRARITGLVIAASVALAACGGAASPTAAPASPAASVTASGPAGGAPAGSAASLPAASTAPGTSASVTIKDFAFGPASLTVSAGSTVTWDNADAVTHSVKWDAGTPGSDPLAHDATYARTFTTPGTYSYVCGIHSRMKGTIVVH